MTLQETKEVLAVVASSFPKYFSNVTKASADRQAVLWHEDLGEYSMSAVMAGVKAYRTADSTGFPPSTGQVISYIHMVGRPSDTNGPEAWALVRRALNVPWDQMEASFDTLPETVRRAVGSAASLRELAQMDTRTFETVAQSNFLRMYDAERKREATEQKIGNAVIGARESIQRELEMRRPGLGRAKARGVGTAEVPQIPQKAPDTGEHRDISGMMDSMRKRLGGKK